MSIRVERRLRNLVHGPYGRWIMLGLLVFILCVFTVTDEMATWLQSLFGGNPAAARKDVAGSFAVLPGETTEVTYARFRTAHRRYGLAQGLLRVAPMDRVRNTDVWVHLVLLEAARKEGVTVSRDELREVMSQAVPDYIFNDEAQYRAWVPQYFRVTAPELEAAVLDYLTALRMRELYRESFVVAPAATRKAAIEQAANQNVELAFGDYAALDAARFLPDVEAALKAEADPDAKLRDFFDKDPSVKLDDRFRHPRRYRMELLYSIHANVNTDAALRRIGDLVRKAYPEAKFKEVNVSDRRTYFGMYKDRLLGMGGSTWDDLTKRVRDEERKAGTPGDPGKPGEPGPDGREPPSKPEEGAPGEPAKPEEGKPEEGKPEEGKPEEPAAPVEPEAPKGPDPAVPPPEPPMTPELRERILKYGYDISKDQVGREVELRSIYEFLYEQTRDNVSLKELYDRLKASDDAENPVCGTEPGKTLIVYRDFGGAALSGAELEAIEDSGVKFGLSFRPRVTRLGETDLPKRSGKADTLGDEGHGRQFFRLLEVIREQRKTFEELTDGEKEELRRLFYLPERARERAKETLEALRSGLAKGEIKADEFRAEAEKLGCRVHAGEWVEATYDFLKEPDKKQLWPREYLHMRDRYFLRKSLAQVLDRDRVKQEWKPPCFLPVDVDIRRGGEDPGAAYLFQLRERKRPDETTIPPGEVAMYLKTFATQRNREEVARWTEDWEQLRTQFRMSFEEEMRQSIDEEQKREEESRRSDSP